MKNLMTVANIRGYVDEHGTAMLIKVAARNPWVLTTWMNCRLPR